jgi:hypothetical protein
MQPLMTTLPPIGPLAPVGAPITATIIVIDGHLLAAACLALCVAAGVLCAVALQAWRARPRTARSRSTRPRIAVPLAGSGGRR